MSCVTYSLSCPIGAIGGECNWTVTCCDGTKQRIILLEGEISSPCIDITAASGGIRKNSTSGETVNTTVSCTSACGTVNPAPSPAPTPTPVTPTPPTPPTPSTQPIPEYCLTASQEVTMQNISGGNKYVFGSNYGTYGVTVGTYILKNVPVAHPIAFQNFNLTNVFTYTGTTSVGVKNGLDGNPYTYYWGDVTLTVIGGPFIMSYECFYHGYMGGENNLIFNSTTCTGPSPTPPTPTPVPSPIPSVVPPVPSPVLTQYTLTYSEGVQGWPSFYSYVPDMMLGMNNYLYSFKGGNLYKHNTNELRNNYYGQQYNSQITSVFNQNPLENKVFKTLNLESDSPWTATLQTDIQNDGFVDSTWFEKKEGAYFAYLRKTGTVPAAADEYALRSANGIGKALNWSQSNNVLTINFSVSPLVSVGSIVSIGDYIYFSEGAYTTVSLSGTITNIEVNLRSGINRIFVNTSVTGSTIISEAQPYILYIKNMEAETHGMLGHQLTFTLTNENTTSTELFAVEAEAMKSYP